MKRTPQIMPAKVFFMVMTLSMTSQGGLKVANYVSATSVDHPGWPAAVSFAMFAQ